MADPVGVDEPEFLPIGQHGLVGDLRTCALVGSDARVDWFCAPRFDSPSVFGSLLDPDRGGSVSAEAVAYTPLSPPTIFRV